MPLAAAEFLIGQLLTGGRQHFRVDEEARTALRDAVLPKIEPILLLRFALQVSDSGRIR